jgi:hypothetical protein
MAMDYVEFQLSSIKIPDIEGTKEWVRIAPRLFLFTARPTSGSTQ